MKIQVDFELPEGMNVPDLQLILSKCIRELIVKYPDYGNSWQTDYHDYWLKRLHNEVNEFESAIGPQAAKRKLINIINIAMLAYSREGML